MSYPQPIIETPRRQPRPWLRIGVAVLALAVGGGAFLFVNRGSDSPGHAVAATGAGASSVPGPAPVETPPLDSISLTPRETSRQCVKDRCMIRFDVVAHVEGPPGEISTLHTWRVTYKVVGADGVKTGSFTMGKRRSEQMPSEVIAIESADAKVWIDVASIELVPE